MRAAQSGERRGLFSPHPGYCGLLRAFPGFFRVEKPGKARVGSREAKVDLGFSGLFECGFDRAPVRVAPARSASQDSDEQQRAAWPRRAGRGSATRCTMSKQHRPPRQIRGDRRPKSRFAGF
jgi:hypothetical protein